MKNIGITIISFILCIILFISEMLFMTLLSIKKGITKEEIINIIEQVNIKQEIEEIETYKELQQKIDKEILDQLITSQEVEQYIKGNAKAIYLNTIYGEELEYVNSAELKNQLNNKADILIENQKITIEQKTQIINTLNEITKNIDEQIENVKQQKEQIQILKTFIYKTTNYALICALGISIALIIINKSKIGYLYAGMPTIITGVLFLILVLGLEGRMSEISLDIETQNFIIKYLPHLLKTIKKTSIIMTFLGLIECTLYKILNYQERSVQNGEI